MAWRNGSTILPHWPALFIPTVFKAAEISRRVPGIQNREYA
jgi:hypothetical protein